MSFLALVRRFFHVERRNSSVVTEGLCAPPLDEKSLPAGDSSTSELGAIYRSDGYERTPEDERFNETIEETMGGHFAFGYYTTIAGTKHRNEDGSSRTKTIRDCAVGELLLLKREPDNPYDSNAIAVRRQDGSQLGYVPRRSADEIVTGMRRRNEVWTALFRKPTRHPDTNRVVGAVILLMLLKP